MPRLDRSFGDDGPIIDVRICVAAARAEWLAAVGSPVPEPFAVPGLVDTGVKVTAISLAIATWMGIASVGMIEASSSVLGRESRWVPVYPLRMCLGPFSDTDPLRWRAIDAAAVDIVSPGASVLIGRDLLASCRFTYDGRKSRLLMSY